MKVLIVDDEAMICEWLQFCIAQNPACRLTGVAHNGREALELFQQNEADLVLTDIKMPVMDGLELLHALRALSERVRVVMLTAFADFDLARRALREGASEYLLKTEMQNEALQELLGRMARQLSVSEGRGKPGQHRAGALHHPQDPALGAGADGRRDGRTAPVRRALARQRPVRAGGVAARAAAGGPGLPAEQPGAPCGRL